MGKRQQDMNSRFQNAPRAFQANKWILCHKHVSMALRLKFSDPMVTCFFSAGNNSVIGRKHRLKPGFVSNQSSWPSLRAGSVSFCIKLLAA